MKKAAVVILYNPDENALTNIKTYYNFFDTIFVFDNTEGEPLHKHAFQQLNKIEYYHDYINNGIAKPLNDAAHIAIDNFDWLLTMDQDSYFLEESINSYMKCFNDYPEKENVAMFGVNYGISNPRSLQKCMATEVEGLITSGTLINLNLYKRIGNFDENLFIDGVDHDYCIRAKIQGFSIIQFSNINLLHQLGKQVFRSSIKSLFIKKKFKTIHNPIRYYYMYSNLLYLKKKFNTIDVQLMESIKKTVYSNILNGIFYGRNSLKILKYLIAAHHDYKTGMMGKIKTF